MADRIKGITIEIGGDTTNLQKSLKDVDKQLRDTQSALKDVNKLLKLDPSNTELLVQKQKNLEKAIDGTKARLAQLKEAQSSVAKGTPEWDNLQREIIATEQDLKKLEKEHSQFGNVASQQIKAAGKAMQDYGAKIEAAGKKIQPLSTAAAGALGALGGLGYKAVTNADDLNTMAKQTGLTTAELQRFQYASDLVDVSLSDITGAVTKTKKAMTGNDKVWKQLGVNVKNADGSMRDATDVFYETLQALSQVENETERDQLAMQVFGKSADSLAGIIDDGGSALKEYGDKAEELGLVLDQQTLDSLNSINDVIDQTKANVTGSLAQAGATLAQAFLPALNAIVPIIDRVSAAIARLTPEQSEMILKVLAVVAAIGPAISIAGKIVSVIGAVTSAVGTVVGVLGGPLTIAIAAVVAAGILIYKNWDTIKATAIALKDAAIAAWQGLSDKISSIVDGIKAKIDSFRQKIEDLKTKVKSVVDAIKNAFSSLKFNLPKIKLPHFAIDPPGWVIGDLVKGIIPKLKIDWYRKAYDNPVMFTSPTVIGTPNGYKGFGDGSGAEIVMGLDKLRELVGQGQNVTVNVVLQGDAEQLFKVVQRQNYVRTKATRYNALAAGV